MKSITINDKEYEIQKLLGHGKGGYSYLVKKADKLYVIKQIHHEPCDYYTFGDKIESEQNDYNRLLEIGITMPKMFCLDKTNERILKEYISGPTIFELIKNNCDIGFYLSQIKKMAQLCYANNINIDYFPTNFVVMNETLFYIDYECNDYTTQWNFENWGIKYWSRTKEFDEYLKGCN